MSAIHVKTLIAYLDRRRTIDELAELTGYPVTRVYSFIWEARAAGYHIVAIMGTIKGDPTTFELRGRN